MHVTRNIKPEFIDERGGITRILDTETPIKSVLLITSKAGTVRSNHYHKKDAHYCYILSGRAEWSEKPVEGGEMESAVLEPGDMVMTPSNTVHAVRFLEDSVMFAFAAENRDQEDYEADTVRVELIEA